MSPSLNIFGFWVAAELFLMWAITAICFFLVFSGLRKLHKLHELQGLPRRFFKPYSTNLDALTVEEMSKRGSPFNREYWSAIRYLFSGLDESYEEIRRLKRRSLVSFSIASTLYIFCVIQLAGALIFSLLCK